MKSKLGQLIRSLISLEMMREACKRKLPEAWKQHLKLKDYLQASSLKGHHLVHNNLGSKYEQLSHALNSPFFKEPPPNDDVTAWKIAHFVQEFLGREENKKCIAHSLYMRFYITWFLQFRLKFKTGVSDFNECVTKTSTFCLFYNSVITIQFKD